VLQCAAVCCSVLQCVAVCCSVLQRVAACCSVFQCQPTLVIRRIYPPPQCVAVYQSWINNDFEMPLKNDSILISLKVTTLFGSDCEMISKVSLEMYKLKKDTISLQNHSTLLFFAAWHLNRLPSACMTTSRTPSFPPFSDTVQSCPKNDFINHMSQERGEPGELATLSKRSGEDSAPFWNPSGIEPIH